MGYLGLDKVFTGNVTGNVVILCMALAGANGLPIAGPLIALFTFMLCAAAGSRVLCPVTISWTTQATVLIGVVGATIAALSISLFALGGTPSQPLHSP